MQVGSTNRGATPIIGNILLVAVVLVVAITVTTLSFAFLDNTGTPTAEAAFDYEQTPAGLQMTPQALGTDVIVKLNGKALTTIEADSAGESVLVPTAPGDRLTVVSTDDEKSVLVDRQVDDRSEVGDFIAYYTFDQTTGDAVVDRSGNGNDGTITGDPTWLSGDGGLQFDGESDYVTVENISAPADVDEFTIAVAYKQQGAGSDDINQLVEHEWSGNEWFLETRDGGSDPYRLKYAVGYPDSSGQIQTDDAYDYGTRNVAVGTYDGNDFELYVNGTSVADGSFDRAVNMGDMRIGRDFESGIQYFEGEIYEVRLYYTAFDGEQVEVITEAMS